MNKYYDYFEEAEHDSDNVTMDEFIAEAMRTDLKFNTLAEELQYQWILRCGGFFRKYPFSAFKHCHAYSIIIVVFLQEIIR